MTRRTRRVATILLTLAALGYLVWQVDLETTVDILRNANLAWFALSVAIMLFTVPVLAARWGWLLGAHDIHERLPWLTRAYFVAYTAGQVLPTSLGGDAVRVVETTRRHPGRATVVTGTVLLERGLGGAATVGLGAVGFILSIGEYNVTAYLWLEGVFVLGTLLLGFLFFARSARPLLRKTQPLVERVRLEKPVRHFYMPSSSASAQPCSGPAPPNATSAKSRGSRPCSTETTRRARTISAFTTSIAPAGSIPPRARCAASRSSSMSPGSVAGSRSRSRFASVTVGCLPPRP